jgi:bifunctional DNase/RNase
VIEVKVVGVGLEPQTNKPLVFLKDEAGNAILPIHIGFFEATAISTKLVGQDPPRPITYDLLGSILGGLEAQVMHVAITELKDDIFFARIAIRYKQRSLDIDSRPSDAIALALRVKAPVYVSEQVMAEAGISQAELEKQQQAAAEKKLRPKGARQRKTDKKPVDELTALKAALKRAVQSEDFEKAAELRDKIRVLEQKNE